MKKVRKITIFKHLKLKLLAICCLWLSASVIAQIPGEPVPINRDLHHVPKGYFVSPVFLPDGNAVLATNEKYSSLYLISLNDGSIREILCDLGCGFRPSLSPVPINRDLHYVPNGQKVGIKLIKNGREIPCILSLETNQIEELHKPVTVAGEVSFSSAGKIAFTIGTDLVVLNSKGRRKHIELGIYANIAPISPDGSKVAFNDENDQIHVIDLGSGERRQITQSDRGYFNPRWSPNSKKILLSSLDGYIKVIDIEDDREYELGKGSAPRWSPNGTFVCYYLIEAAELRPIKDSEICIASYDGRQRYQVTNTPERLEMNPSFSPDGKSIVYDTYKDRSIFVSTLTENYTVDSTKLVIKAEEALSIKYQALEKRQLKTIKSLDIPYIHQVYDTPNWFNGNWACAPATAMMAIIYFHKLPHWDCTVDIPYPHTSHWGRYLCEKYNYREITYDWQAQDPSGNWAKGGYGYMWSGSHSPHSVMDDYINYHGISSWHTNYPAWSGVISELEQDYPYPLCVGLTASGHLVLALGYVSGQHTLICNDPYGNKNTPGYPSYDGKDVHYDWPGYNHGNENLNNVYWAVGARGSFPPPSETVVDDLALYDGFFMFTAPSQPKDYWWWFSELSGWEGHMWWTYTEETEDVYYATWTPELPHSNNYEVFAYIPSTDATATSAQYMIYFSGGNQTVIINQNDYYDQWVSLGTYWFNAGQSGYVRLGDATGIAGQHLAFDAIKWVETTPTPTPTVTPTATPTVTPTVTPTPTPVPTPDIDIEPGSLDFGQILIGSAKDLAYEIGNQGDAPLEVTSLEIKGDDADHFSFVNLPDLPLTIPSNTFESITVRFHPTRLCYKNSYVETRSNDPDEDPFTSPTLQAKAHSERLELCEIEVNDSRLLNIAGDYEFLFDNYGVHHVHMMRYGKNDINAVSGLTALQNDTAIRLSGIFTQDARGRLSFIGTIREDDTASSITTKGKLKIKRKTDELSAKLKQAKAQATGAQVKLALVVADGDLELTIKYKKKDVAKIVRTASEPLVCTEPGAWIVIPEMKEIKPNKRYEGEGTLSLPCGVEVPVTVKEKIKEKKDGSTIRRYNIKGEGNSANLKLKVSVPSIDAESMELVKAKGKISYVKKVDPGSVAVVY